MIEGAGGGALRPGIFDAAVLFHRDRTTLTQYAMGGRRAISAAVADLNDAGHPAVLALIRPGPLRAARKARCRGFALRATGGPPMIPALTSALLATGLRTLSVAPVTGSTAQGGRSHR